MAGGIWPPAPISDRIHASYCQTSTQICPLAICGGLGLARLLPDRNLAWHVACWPLKSCARAPAIDRRSSSPRGLATPPGVRSPICARNQRSGQHSAAARAPVHLGVAVGRPWVVRSGGGHAPGPSVPRAVRHTPPAPALNRALVLTFCINSTRGRGGRESPRWIRALGEGDGRTNRDLWVPPPKNTDFH